MANENISMAGIGALITGQLGKTTDSKYWYDFYHSYYVFGEEYTTKIDSILSNPKWGKMGTKQFISEGNFIPWKGIHYYIEGGYYFNYIGLEKVIHEETKKFFYIAWVAPWNWGKLVLQSFIARLTASARDTIQVISIDISDMSPALLLTTKTCLSPKPHQQNIINTILKQYAVSNNIKAWISGPPGSGKTYTGMLLKRAIEKACPAKHVRLYDDFDPKATGVNIGKLALCYASEFSPVILVLNEINTIYNDVIIGSADYDPRLKHARNKTTFNNMLDAIASTPHVIMISTSEVSHETIRENNDLKSFIRPGRVDFFVTMTSSTSTIHSNPL